MSKSVSDSSNAAPIGMRKRTVMAKRPGARNIHAARASCRGMSAATAGLRARQDPAALLEDEVHVAVERGERRGDGLAAADGALEVLGDLLRDLLPLQHARQRRHADELVAEGAGLLVVGERRIVP